MAGRQYIPVAERYAAVLSLLLPENVRADLLKRKVEWKEVERIYKAIGHQIDHNVTVNTDDSDNQKRWWNLNYMSVADHKVKTAKDQQVHAKARRFERLEYTGSKRTPAQQKRYKPIPSRKFPSKEEKRRMFDRFMKGR